MRLHPLTCALLALLATLVPPLQAGRIDAGTIEMGVDMELDFNGANGTTYSGDLRGGYFVVDGVLVGGCMGFQADDDWTGFGLHAFLEQHFETDTPWIPYVGGSLGFEYCSYEYRADDVKISESDNALVLGLSAGVKFFITETTALDLGLALDIASEDIYHASDGDGDNVDATLGLGLRFFLF